LWLQFAEGLGVSKEDVQASEKWNETSNLIGTFRSVCSKGTTAEGLAALYAYESQIPAVSESKITGLVENYNMTEPRDYQYFTVHVAADREHAAAERSMLDQYVTADNAATTAHAVDRILDALWEMLSGVCRRHAIACG
jgi:pyrroloquinoline-quinone synthase